ncbi:MAG TPA: phenylphosphate carboxylase subunit beta [Syntrophorhabdus sp.]|jgi:4-hydroxy-3-polyprenylbenzoate decarboxylase|nr:phenylphosphate carboxylase subunit beta [Syntrophorhabdus sp.]OPX94513.1 MAG: Phenolic acid decarboxylase subunit C [Syntrophorhabdus sp. PtaB.Bin027]MBP8744085.1 phenylphosphate carboxylase subunit beta [Syntrophorhabdus sp.]HQG25967.1 phenylphosphate carboxylase subunit beta [Syntrophorhabdus sp.]HQH82896.1 phenylphosphate carboxylase subunit beta [Syntrophorhabdus sp.]
MDLRDFVAKCEMVGQLKRVKAEVDWDLEISHVAKVVEEKSGPALLFEKIKGYTSPVLTGAFGTTQRLAIILGKDPNLSMVQLTREWVDTAVKALTPAKEVKDGPIFENILEGDKIDTFAFPSPKFYELDGGRYFGTAVFMVIQDPETGDINLGTYRMGILDEKSVGVQILKGKKADRIMKKYAKQGKKMPACAIIGGDPLHIFAGAATIKAKSGYDVVSSLRGEPVEIVKGQVTGLPIPAAAEIVLEGEIDPTQLRNEGPFGEYTGYYTEELIKPIPKPALDVKRIYYRNNPILWETSVGRPVGDQHILYAFTRNASLWTDLTKMEIPGIKSVYTLPEGSGRFIVVVSVQQMYPGHADQIGAAVIASNTGTYGIKMVIIVDDDIDADDLPRVWWALGTRYNPLRGTQLINRGRSTPLDPAIGADENKFITSRVILDATIPFDWKIKPTEIALNQDMFNKVKARWKEYGID